MGKERGKKEIDYTSLGKTKARKYDKEREKREHRKNQEEIKKMNE